MNLERRPEYAVNWPRAVQTGIAILGSVAVGAIAYGYGYGGGGRTESYPQSTAAAVSAPNATFGAGANEPAGARAFVDYIPAVHLDTFEAALGSGSGYSLPALYSSNWLTQTDTITEAGAPGGIAAAQVWPNTGGAASGGYVGFSDWRAYNPDDALYPGWADTLGTLDTLYIRGKFRKNSGWEFNGSGEKLFGLTMDHGDNNLDVYVPQVSSETRFRLQGGLSGADVPSGGGIFFPVGGHDSIMVAGDVYDVELLMISQSACGVADGSFRLWINGEETPNWFPSGGGVGDTIASGDPLNICGGDDTNPEYRSTNAFPFYWGGSGNKTQQDTIFWYGIYMSGND